MRILGKRHLLKLKKKNSGNKKLVTAIDEVMNVFENATWKSKEEVQATRPDADCVHNDGFYFLDLNIHRTLTLIVYHQPTINNLEDDGEKMKEQYRFYGQAHMMIMNVYLKTTRRPFTNG